MSQRKNERSRILATSAAPSNNHSASARVIGSAIAGLSELLLFHPIDTVAKRLMSNKSRTTGLTNAETIANLDKVIFKDAVNLGGTKKYLSLFPGLGFGAGYKILQRVYKFGGQPFVKDFFAHSPSISAGFEKWFGKKHSKTMMHATAGSIIGVGEIVLLPLDVLKIKAQTNPESLAGRGVVEIFRTEGFNLYRGAGWTAARNAPGSFALFGGAAFVKEYIFHLDHYGDATWYQDFCASIMGAFWSITVASPTDVIKTRIQNQPFSSRESGVSIVKNIIAHEGPGAFFKGLIPKLTVVGPKLIFSFTVAQHLISFLDNKL